MEAHAADALIGFLDGWSASAGLEVREMDVMGFSQGAALAYVLAGLFPERVGALAALSGFIPSGAEAVLAAGALDGKVAFVAHGRQDDMVPIERARRAAAQLRAAGAQVTFCETDGGHKVSRECLRSMEAFFAALNSR